MPLKPRSRATSSTVRRERPRRPRRSARRGRRLRGRRGRRHVARRAAARGRGRTPASGWRSRRTRPCRDESPRPPGRGRRAAPRASPSRRRRAVPYVRRGQVERERAALARLRCTRISPPSRRAISRLIERPRPVPPYLRAVVPSACWNASKISRSLSSGMPMPVSITENAITRLGARRASAARSCASSGATLDAQRHAALLGELERVREQVLQHLLQALLVGDDRRRHVRAGDLDREARGPSPRRPAGTCARRSRARRRARRRRRARPSSRPRPSTGRGCR